MYVAYYPDLAFPGAAETVGAFARLAVDGGVRRLVLLSGRNEEGALRGELEVRESGAEWTVVRSSFMNQNFSEAFWLDGILEGELAFPAGEVAEPFIDAEDIADVAVAALTEDGHTGQVYEVTGPRLLTFTEAVGEIGSATGRDIRYVPVTLEQYGSALREAGLPGRLRRRADQSVRRSPGRPQRAYHGRRAARAGAGASGLRGVREGGSRDGRLGRRPEMSDGLVFALTLIAALGSGLMAGTFFAFSTFVMQALARLAPGQGIAAMQSINVVVINPLFMAGFMGTAAVCVVLAVVSLVRWDESEAAYALAGSLLYLVGTFGVTIAFNVPRNDALAAVDPDSDDGARVWAGYVRSWTAWNHVRTVAALAAAGALIIALALHE